MDAGCPTTGTKRCVGLTPQTCGNAGKWQSSADCPFVCDSASGTCAGVCVPGTKTCNGLTPQTCDAKGTWQSAAGCPFVCDSASATCTGVCAPGSVTCNGLTPRTCDATGAWQDGKICPFVCDSASGSCTGTCVPGSKGCAGRQPQTCDATGTFQADGAACPFVCDATMGVCTGVCVPGAKACADTTHSEVCDATGQWQQTACTQVCSPAAKACACASGYTGDGVTCNPIDFCAAANGGCSPNATCTQSGITPSCTCTGGNVGDGFSCTRATVTLDEGFDDVSNLSAGWSIRNSSSPIGLTAWFQGTSVAASGPFDAFDGAGTSYIAANYANTEGGLGIISDWLVTPVLDFGELAQLSFYTRKMSPDVHSDRIEVRLCSGTPCAPPLVSGIGGFTTALLVINPTLLPGIYPTTWTKQTLTNADGIPLEGSGRIAIRYFVTSAGPTGTNSDYIGIDRLVYQVGAPAFTVSASVSGVTGAGLVLWLNGNVKLPVPADGSYTFPPRLDTGTPYAVRVFAQPNGQTCTVTNASGTVGNAGVSNVQVACTAIP